MKSGGLLALATARRVLPALGTQRTQAPGSSAGFCSGRAASSEQSLRDDERALPRVSAGQDTRHRALAASSDKSTEECLRSAGLL